MSATIREVLRIHRQLRRTVNRRYYSRDVRKTINRGISVALEWPRRAGEVCA